MTTLKNICRKITDGSHNPPAGISRSNYFMISSKNIENDLITFKNPRFLSKNDFINENKRTNIETNDVLLTIVGAIGRVAVVTSDKIPFCVQRSIAVLKIDTTKSIPRFVMYYLQSKTSFFEKESRGVAQKGIYLKQIENFPFLLLPLYKQKKIVNVLDKIHLIINYRKQQLSKLDHLVKSRFVEMFGDTRNNINSFKVYSIGDICSLKSGTSLPLNVENEGGDIPYIKVSDMSLPGNERYITTSSRYVTKKTASKGIFPIGSVIFPKRGGAIGTNKKRLTQIPICVDLNIMGVIPGTNITPHYLLSYFDMIDLGKLDNGSSVPQLNNKDIAPLKILLPPLPLQEQFAAFVQQVDKAKSSVKQSLETLETLKKSLMQEYFG